MSELPHEFLSVPGTATGGLDSVAPLDSRRARRARSLAAEVGMELGFANPAPQAVAVQQTEFRVLFSDDARDSEQYPRRV